MIELVPFYLSLNSEIHHQIRDAEDTVQNRRYSLSLLNSMLAVLIDKALKLTDSCVVIAAPSPAESNVIVSSLIREINERQLGPNVLNLVKRCDLKPDRIVDEKGIHVISVMNANKVLVSCENLLSYYPMTMDLLNGLYRRTRRLVLFNPVNPRDNDYSMYIKMVVDKRTGVRK